MFNLHRIRLLREVQLRGSLAAAATALGYDPSTVSQQLKVLEREIGSTLLQPVGRRVTLTPAALVLIRHGEAMLQSMERAEAEIAALQHEVTGTIRLATFQTVAHAFVIDAIAALGSDHPELTVELAEFDVQHALPALLAREHDIVLQEAYPGHTAPLVAGMDLEPLGEDPLVLLDPLHRPLEKLSMTPWVMEPPGTLARSWAEAACRAAGFEPIVRYTTSDLALHLRIVTAGLASALIPRLAISPQSALAMQRLPDNPRRTFATAVRAGSAAAPAIRTIRRALRAAHAAAASA